MERKIMEVLRKMQEFLNETQLNELKTVLHMVMSENELMMQNDSWRIDMEDFLISKALEGRTPDTINQYRYELNRLLSYINKPVQNIDNSDISSYMRAYKITRSIKNSTLKGIRAIYSSFFVWLRNRNRIQKNPIVLVEKIKTEKR